MAKIEITQDFLKQLFDYRDGRLFYKIKASNAVEIGMIAGCWHRKKDQPCIRVKIKSTLYKNSRLVFMYHHGYFPEEVDHINWDTKDDRIENLRAATRAQNLHNRRAHKDSKSQYLGVSLRKNKYWVVSVIFQGKSIYLGTFKTEIEAALTYNKWAVKHHGEFANLNIIKKPNNIPNID